MIDELSSSMQTSECEEPQREDGAWFKQLDWNDEEKYANFGLNKDVNRTTNLSDLKAPPREQQTI